MLHSSHKANKKQLVHMMHAEIRVCELLRYCFQCF